MRGDRVCATLTSRPQSGMAAVDLSILLFALISSAHREDFLVHKEMDSHTFNLTEEADFCLISRLVGEERLVLWNTSDLLSKNSTVPEDLKQRLSVVSGASISSYVISNLTHSDSGQYQEKCWTEGNVTYERNTNITICSVVNERTSIAATLGGGADLPCEGAAGGLDVKWFKSEYRYMKGSTTSLIHTEKTTSTLRVSNFSSTPPTLYTCLVMKGRQCVSSHATQLFEVPEMIYHAVEEAAVLRCTVTDYSGDEPPQWEKFDSETKSYVEMGQNHSLLFPSLTLNHSGWYSCKANVTVQSYWLVVCPAAGPAVVELFSEGDEVTLRCRYSGESAWHFWFIKTNQTGGRVRSGFPELSHLGLSRVGQDPNASLFISNASLEHRGEYWCVVIQRSDQQCTSTTKALLKVREPFGIHSSFYTARCSLLGGLLVVLCAVVAAVIQKTRSGTET